ncbi:MAG TPA: helix-turn-helix domain-containing protein [Solirubrobacteraceae bacterium]|nr:helix-turn-helix domain-containing protein [Solirubrobacteraceae bacterium]
MVLQDAPIEITQPPVGGRIERRKARTRARLLAAARELFAKRGLEGTAIADIAENADVATGSFYNYFATKQELLEALLEDELSRQLELLQARQAQTEDVAEKISIAHRHLVRVAQTDPSWGWLFVRLDLPYRAAWSTLGGAAERDLTDGITLGRFDVADPALALAASGGALLAVIQAQLSGDLGPDADAAHAEGVLRSFGIAPSEAAAIANRPLPEIPSPGGSEEP